MRLPYIQVDGDFITQRSRSVAALLGCSHAQAIGHLSLLWGWVLSQGSDDAPPSGLITGPHAARLVKAAAEWEGSTEALVDVLSDPQVGLLERIPDGFRVRGLERYAKAWDKQRKDRERKADVRRTSSGHPSDGAGKTQTQTQTQTQKEEGTTSSAPVPGPSAPPLVLAPQEPEKPKRAPSPTALGEFIDWARAEVRPHLRPDAPDPAILLQHQRLKLGEAVKLHGLEALKAAFRLWMGWHPAQEKGYPLGFFAAQWEQWVGQVKAPKTASPAAPGRGGSEGACAGCGTQQHGGQAGSVHLGYGCGCLAAWEASGVPYTKAAEWARAHRAGRAA